jgi:hypothetical protein
MSQLMPNSVFEQKLEGNWKKEYKGKRKVSRKVKKFLHQPGKKTNNLEFDYKLFLSTYI